MHYAKLMAMAVLAVMLFGFAPGCDADTPTQVVQAGPPPCPPLPPNPPGSNLSYSFNTDPAQATTHTENDSITWKRDTKGMGSSYPQATSPGAVFAGQKPLEDKQAPTPATTTTPLGVQAAAQTQGSSFSAGGGTPLTGLQKAWIWIKGVFWWIIGILALLALILFVIPAIVYFAVPASQPFLSPYFQWWATWVPLFGGWVVKAAEKKKTAAATDLHKLTIKGIQDGKTAIDREPAFDPLGLVAIDPNTPWSVAQGTVRMAIEKAQGYTTAQKARARLLVSQALQAKHGAQAPAVLALKYGL